MSYIRNPLYDDTKLGKYLDKELRKIENQIIVNDIESLSFKVWHVSPSKPRQGQLYYLDGSDFDPLGTGSEGLYRHTGSAWVYVG